MLIDRENDQQERQMTGIQIHPVSSIARISCFPWSCHLYPSIVGVGRHNWGTVAHVPASYPLPSVPTSDVPLVADFSTSG